MNVQITRQNFKVLIARLKILIYQGAKNVEIIGDSQLVIKQLTHEYRCVSHKFDEVFVSCC